ncbi:MAG: DUF721 domain-containing protein [Elusimicrobiota bacterium]
MILEKEKSRRWSTSSDLVKSFTYRAGTVNNKLALLNAVWDKECGAYAKYWALVAVKKGTLFVRPKSAAAAQELQMRSGGLLKSLNKYFSRPWILVVKTTYRL